MAPQMVNTPVAGGGLYQGSGRGGSGMTGMIGQLGSIILGAQQQKLDKQKYQTALTKQYQDDYYANPELIDAMNPFYRELFKDAYRLKDDEVDQFMDDFKHEAPTDPKLKIKAKTEAVLNDRTPIGSDMPKTVEETTTTTTPKTTDDTIPAQTTDPSITTTDSTTQETKIQTATYNGKQIKVTTGDPVSDNYITIDGQIYNVVPDDYDASSKKMTDAAKTKSIWPGANQQGEGLSTTAIETGGLSTGEISKPEVALKYLEQRQIQNGITGAKATANAQEELKLYTNNPSASINEINTKVQAYEDYLLKNGTEAGQAKQIANETKARVMDYFGIVETGQEGVQFKYQTSYGPNNKSVNSGEVEQREGKLYFVPTENMTQGQDISYYSGIAAYYNSTTQAGSFDGYYNLVLKEPENREKLDALYNNHIEDLRGDGKTLKSGDSGKITDTNGNLTDFGYRYMMDWYGAPDITDIKLPDMGNIDNVITAANPNVNLTPEVTGDEPADIKAARDNAAKIYVIAKDSAEELKLNKAGYDTKRQNIIDLEKTLYATSNGQTILSDKIIEEAGK